MGAALAPTHSNALALSTSASCTTRENQTVFISLEGGKPGTWRYRQPISHRSGYSTLAMTDGGLIADLFEEGGCQLTLALVDPKAMIADGPKGPIPCADANCPASPFAPQARFDGTRGFCKSDDTESFRFIATLHTPQPPIRCSHRIHLWDVSCAGLSDPRCVAQ